MKTRTQKQVQTAKLRAERFVENVLGDADRAEEIADETIGQYAERRGILIKNPLAESTTKKGSLVMQTRAQLQEELDVCYERIAELEDYIGEGQELISSDDDEEISGDENEEEE